MQRIYVVTNGMYSDMYIAGASTSLVDAAKIVVDKACTEYPLIDVFEGGNRIEGEGSLHFMYCNLWGSEIAPAREDIIDYVPGNVNVPPIVKVFPDAKWSPAVFVIGAEHSKVAQAFSDTLAAEAAKRGWVSKW